MKIVTMVTAALLVAGTAFAQVKTITDADKVGVFVSAQEVADAVAKLPKNPLASVPLMKVGPYNLNIEHRLGAPAEAQAGSIHDKDAELFIMMEGTATLVTGGKLIDAVRMGDNWRGKGIEGGKAQKMSKGDFMLVPAGVPHWFTDIQGNITEFSLHLPVK